MRKGQVDVSVQSLEHSAFVDVASRVVVDPEQAPGLSQFADVVQGRVGRRVVDGNASLGGDRRTDVADHEAPLLGGELETHPVAADAGFHGASCGADHGVREVHRDEVEGQNAEHEDDDVPVHFASPDFTAPA